MRRGTGQFDGAGATEELFLSGPSPRSRRSCIKKPHRKSSSKPPLRHAEVLVLVTCLHCQSCLIITKSKGTTVLGVGASQVAGLLGEGPHPAGGRAGMMGRERDYLGTEGRGRIRGQRGKASTEFRACLPHTPTPCLAKNCQLPRDSQPLWWLGSPPRTAVQTSHNRPSCITGAANHFRVDGQNVRL